LDIKNIISKLGISPLDEVELLAGDASTRKYYRIRTELGSYVLMLGDAYDVSDPNIINYNILKKAGIRVPEFFKLEPHLGVILQEDIGCLHLQDLADKNDVIHYYHDAIKNMQTYHRCSTQISFTKEKFMSELTMTYEYYVRLYMKREMDKELVLLVNNSIVEPMMLQPFAYLHRDYHSRNLMVKGEELVIIDFQDARMGPYSYDIASLTIDPYISLDKSSRELIVEKYYDLVAAPLFKVSKDEYMKDYYISYLQRGIKMLGTFSYQSIVRKKDDYLKYIPTLIDDIKIVSKKFPEWNDLIKEVYLN
jgi:N-acetylmuramate 1-kinase